jgi:hypothetical protein
LLYPLLLIGRSKHEKLKAAFQSQSPKVRATACSVVFISAMLVGFALCGVNGFAFSKPWPHILQRELRECFLDLFVLVPFFVFTMKLYFDESITVDPWVDLANFFHVGSAYFGDVEALNHVTETGEDDAGEKMDAQQSVLEFVAIVAVLAFGVGVILRSVRLGEVIQIVPFSEETIILFSAMGLLAVLASLGGLLTLRELTQKDASG